MATKFYAVTAIRHGARVEDGSAEGKYVRTEFAVGDEVTGLPKADMKSLWEAGALERRGDEESKEADASEETPKETSTSSTKAPTPKAPAAQATAKSEK